MINMYNNNNNIILLQFFDGFLDVISDPVLIQKYTHGYGRSNRHNNNNKYYYL